MKIAGYQSNLLALGKLFEILIVALATATDDKHFDPLDIRSY